MQKEEKKEEKWYRISEDELESRMIRHKIMHDEVISKAGAMVYKALDEILTMLGVDVNGDIEMQQDVLGIHVLSMGDDWSEGVRGMTVAKQVGKDIAPYAWISEAKVENDGRIYCEAQVFHKNLLLRFECGRINAEQKNGHPLG